MRQLIPALALCCGLAAPLAAAEPAGGPVDLMPARPLMAEKLLALAIIPDPRALLANLELTARGLSDDPTPEGMLAAQAGHVLADPNLNDLAPGPLLVVLPTGLPRPQIGVVVPMANTAQAAQRLQANGWQAEALGNLVVMGHTAQGLAAAKAIAPQWAALAKSERGSDVILHADLAAVGTTYGPMIQMAMGFAAMAPQDNPMATAFVQRVLPAMQVLGGHLGGELEGLRLKLSLGAETIACDSVLSYRAGGSMAKGFKAPVAGEHRALALLPSDSQDVVRYSMRYDADAAQQFVDACIAALAADARTANLLDQATVAASKHSMNHLAGDAAMSVRSVANSSDIGTRSVQLLRDPAAHRALMQEFLRLSNDPQTSVGAFLQQVGATMRHELAVRQVDGVAVERIEWVLSDAVRAQPEMAKAFGPQEHALRGNVAYMSSGEPIDALLKPLAAAPLPLAAQAIGPGRHLYTDVDLPGYMALSLAVSGNEQIPLDRAALERGRGQPLQVAATLGEARQAWELRLPVRGLRAVADAFRSAIGGPRRHPGERGAPAPTPRQRPGGQDPHVF
jgi:hypothetical protein